MTKFKFRLGSDPLGSLTADDVLDRIEKLSDDYAYHASTTEVLYPKKVRAWAVTEMYGGQWCFAPAKVLGYAKDVKSYVRMVENEKPMTGIDAVTALNKRGFIDCDPYDFPEIRKHFEHWIEERVGYSPRSEYRFLIHRKEMARISPTIKRILTSCAQLQQSERKALIDLLAANEV